MPGMFIISRAMDKYSIEGIFLGKTIEEMSQAKENIENIPDVIDVSIEVFVDTPLLCAQNFELD
jgi:hypothetical protein